YTVEPMNATSMTPPNGSWLNFRGRPLAYSDFSPLARSMRQISPAAGCGTYSAPPGPTALPEAAPPANVASNSGSPGSVLEAATLAETGTVSAASAATTSRNLFRLSTILSPFLSHAAVAAESGCTTTVLATFTISSE